MIFNDLIFWCRRNWWSSKSGNIWWDISI